MKKGYIFSYNDIRDFFFGIFHDKSNFKDIELVDVGDLIIIRAKFWNGPFNVEPIEFEYRSNYLKQIDRNHLLMSVIGACAKNSFYYIEAKGNDIKIKKRLEVM